MRAELHQILQDASLELGTKDRSDCTCAWSSKHGLAYMNQLQEMKLGAVSMFNMPICDVIQEVERMEDPAPRCKWFPCMVASHLPTSCRRRFICAQMDAFKAQKGLCIDCVRSGTSDGKRTESCRIEH